MMKSFLQNTGFGKAWWLFAVLILLIPTYFIHTQKYPDWGDDFAQYIYQGQQINSPSETYRKVVNVEEYSSPKRSVVFSLVLSIVRPTDFIQRYVDLISICYIMAGICFFLFLTAHFSHMVSFIATLCVFYNFLLLRLKSEVVPEFLFIALFYVILYLVNNSNRGVRLFIPGLLAVLVSVRFVGLSLVISYLIFLLILNERPLKQKLKEVGIGILIFVLVVTGINYFFLNTISNQEIKLYGNLVFKNYGLRSISENISLYSRYLLLFFEQEIPYRINSVIKLSAIVLFLTGFIVSLKNQLAILHLSLMVYFLFLFIYPYNGDTIKYLIPVFPLVMVFIVKGMHDVLTYIAFKRKELIVSICLSVLLLSNAKTIWYAMQHKNINIGPYDSSVLTDFKKIKENTKVNETIAFGKPFVINLLADRDSYFLSKENHQIILSKADYFLSPKEKISELYPKMDGIIATKGDTLELVNFYLIRL